MENPLCLISFLFRLLFQPQIQSVIKRSEEVLEIQGVGQRQLGQVDDLLLNVDKVPKILKTDERW